MLHAIVRCSHCGKEYTRQLSGWSDGTNEKSHDDYCPECYALIKDELNALEKKLRSKEMKERQGRFLHAYVEVETPTIEELKTSWEMIYRNGEPFGYGCERDGWGYLRIHGGCDSFWIGRDNKVYEKVLVDTKTNKIVSKKCTSPLRYKDDIFHSCTNASKEDYKKWSSDPKYMSDQWEKMKKF